MTILHTAKQLWTQGNNAGRGYAPYTDVPGADTIDAAIEAAEADGWEVVARASTSADVTVLKDGDGAHMAIGDSNGPWAVIISDEPAIDA